MPLGIITLEDVLEANHDDYLELIGEEIYDEFDPQGARGDPYQVPPETKKVEFPTSTGVIAAPTAAPANSHSTHRARNSPCIRATHDRDS
ncbi:hypothetical protein H0H92_006197 [Tricholoma furcatifolium]|nr:hypothetical protein H0H92_006197 [Tricholoma furcatifolium]